MIWKLTKTKYRKWASTKAIWRNRKKSTTSCKVY